MTYIQGIQQSKCGVRLIREIAERGVLDSVLYVTERRGQHIKGSDSCRWCAVLNVTYWDVDVTPLGAI